MKKYNFNAGPSILPQEVIKQTAEAVIDFQGKGLSILEISHRAKYFQPVMDEAEALMKELLNVPEGYRVLFLGGGASLQFCMVPFNLLEKKAAYLNTGVWSKKALKEAKGFGEAIEVAASTDSIPMDFEIPQDADYFHITTNNTIFGTEISDEKLAEIYKKKGNVPLVADMSLRRRAEELSSCRSNIRDHQRELSGQSEPLYPDDAELSDAYRRRFDVQHSSCPACLYGFVDPSLAQSKRRR